MAGQLATTDAPSRDLITQAYELRCEGKSLAYILDHTDFESTYDVIQAIKAYHAEAALDTIETRSEAVQMEIDRLDAIQSQMWEAMTTEEWKYDSEGDALERTFDTAVKAAKVIIDCIKQRSALKGLENTDISQAQAAVLIVGGNQGDFIRNLIDQIPEHARPKDTAEVLKLEAHPAD